MGSQSAVRESPVPETTTRTPSFASQSICESDASTHSTSSNEYVFLDDAITDPPVRKTRQSSLVTQKSPQKSPLRNVRSIPAVIGGPLASGDFSELVAFFFLDDAISPIGRLLAGCFAAYRETNVLIASAQELTELKHVLAAKLKCCKDPAGDARLDVFSAVFREDNILLSEFPLSEAINHAVAQKLRGDSHHDS